MYISLFLKLVCGYVIYNAPRHRCCLV